MSVKVSTPPRSIANLVWLPWSLAGVVTFLALLTWLRTMSWSLDAVTAYSLFPVLGLVAFSLMWTHYIVGMIPTQQLPETARRRYANWTGYVVLILLLLHPGILIYQRFKDGYGLPPGSYQSYVIPSMAWLTLLGSMSLLVFLAYETKRWFDTKRWWRYFLIVNDIAMLAVFYHGLRLGSQTQMGWFKYLWLLYGLTLVLVLIRKYTLLIRQHSRNRS